MKTKHKLPKASWTHVPQWFEDLYTKHDAIVFDPTYRTAEVLAYRAYLMGRKTREAEIMAEARAILEM